jgi:hypothetical protein
MTRYLSSSSPACLLAYARGDGRVHGSCVVLTVDVVWLTNVMVAVLAVV